MQLRTSKDHRCYRSMNVRTATDDLRMGEGCRRRFRLMNQLGAIAAAAAAVGVAVAKTTSASRQSTCSATRFNPPYSPS